MNGTEGTIRFIGIDTPETHKPNTPVQYYGPAASAYTKNRIGNQSIRLVSDSLTTDRDRYDRLLRYVVLENGTTLNLELIQKGYAFACVFPFSRSNEFFTEMDKAHSAQLGLWGNCALYQDPKTGRWHTENQS
jgi:micrococcal nuclease